MPLSSPGQTHPPQERAGFLLREQKSCRICTTAPRFTAILQDLGRCPKEAIESCLRKPVSCRIGRPPAVIRPPYQGREAFPSCGGAITAGCCPFPGATVLLRFASLYMFYSLGNKHQTFCPMSSPITVILADDHCLVRAGFKTLISSEEELQLLGVANDGAPSSSPNLIS